jgi:hypothetical protein
MGLTRADPNATKRFERDDGAWIEIRTSLSGREDAVINDCTASERILREDGRVALQPPKQEFSDPRVFELLVVAWSLEDGKPKREDYDALEAGDRRWVNECISEAVATARGEVEGNSSSPRKADQPSDSPDSSQAEASQAPAI